MHLGWCPESKRRHVKRGPPHLEPKGRRSHQQRKLCCQCWQTRNRNVVTGEWRWTVGRLWWVHHPQLAQELAHRMEPCFQHLVTGPPGQVATTSTSWWGSTKLSDSRPGWDSVSSIEGDLHFQDEQHSQKDTTPSSKDGDKNKAKNNKKKRNERSEKWLSPAPIVSDCKKGRCCPFWTHSFIHEGFGVCAHRFVSGGGNGLPRAVSPACWRTLFHSSPQVPFQIGCNVVPRGFPDAKAMPTTIPDYEVVPCCH